MAETENESPGFLEVIDSAVDARLCDVHTLLPGRVEAYDAATQKATIQPLLKRKFKDAGLVNLPPVTNVPVAMFRSGNAWVTLPIKIGSTGALIFSERSLDVWLDKGGIVSPEDVRKFDLSDGVFYPGMHPFTDPADASPDKLVVQHGNMRMELGEDGKITVTNLTSGAELVDLFSTTLDTMSKEPLLAFASVYAALKVLLDTMKE